MAQDLYTEWLSVASSGNLPDHYTLLGLPLFCDDIPAIEQAARKQLAKLDRYAIHPDPQRRDACQRMMNQVAKARIVLVSPERRDAYNRQMGEHADRDARGGPSRPIWAGASSASFGGSETGRVVPAAPGPSIHTIRRARALRTRWIQTGAVAAGVVALGLIAYRRLSSPSKAVTPIATRQPTVDPLKSAGFIELGHSGDVKEAATAPIPRPPAGSPPIAPDANDPAAALKIGRFLCFHQGDWETGLHLFAICDEPTLKELAARELAGVVSADDKLKLADGWWRVSQRETGQARLLIQSHAGFWYGDAAPKLSGLAKAKVDNRIKEIEVVDNQLADLAGRSGDTKELLVKLGLPREMPWAKPTQLNEVEALADAIDLKAPESRIVWTGPMPDEGSISFALYLEPDFQPGILFSNARTPGGFPSFEVKVVETGELRVAVSDGNWRELGSARQIHPGTWTAATVSWGFKGIAIVVGGQVSRLRQEAVPDGSAPDGSFGIGRVYGVNEASLSHAQVRVSGVDISK